MKDVLDRTDNTFPIAEVISSTYNEFGPAAELVCGSAAGSAGEPSLLDSHALRENVISICCRLHKSAEGFRFTLKCNCISY